MNKKERVCDVDNIVEWRHIIAILLAVIVVSGRAQTSFDTGDGCLNVIDISYAQGIGEYGYPLSYLYQRSIRSGAPFSIRNSSLPQFLVFMDIFY